MRQSAVVLLSCLLLLPGCSFDHREKIAMALLYPSEDGSKIPATIEGALLGRFPINSPVADLKKFVVSLGGVCRQMQRTNAKTELYDLECSVFEEGGYCWEYSLDISVQTNADKITKISVFREGAGC